MPGEETTRNETRSRTTKSRQRQEQEEERQRNDLSWAWQKLFDTYKTVETVEISQRRKELIFGVEEIPGKAKRMDLPHPWIVLTAEEINESRRKAGDPAAFAPQESFWRTLRGMRAAPVRRPRAAPRGFEVGTREEQRFQLFMDAEGAYRFLAWTMTISESQPE